MQGREDQAQTAELNALVGQRAMAQAGAAQHPLGMYAAAANGVNSG